MDDALKTKATLLGSIAFGLCIMAGHSLAFFTGVQYEKANKAITSEPTETEKTLTLPAVQYYYLSEGSVLSAVRSEGMTVGECLGNSIHLTQGPRDINISFDDNTAYDDEFAGPLAFVSCHVKEAK